MARKGTNPDLQRPIPLGRQGKAGRTGHSARGDGATASPPVHTSTCSCVLPPTSAKRSPQKCVHEAPRRRGFAYTWLVGDAELVAEGEVLSPGRTRLCWGKRVLGTN